MKLVVLTALIAVCGAAKLDRTYLPPVSAKTAGGSPGSLQAPLGGSSDFPSGLPKGGYTNEFQGVVVDASAAGTRAAGPGDSALGAPRPSYGSEASKVGEAAFKAGPAAGFRQPFTGSNQNSFQNFGVPNVEQSSHTGAQFDQSSIQSQFGSAPAQEQPQFGQASAQAQFGSSLDQTQIQVFGSQEAGPERPQASFDRSANVVRLDSEVGSESYNYAFETENGITAEEAGVATNGVQAQGGFSYVGDDGQTYSVSYTADEGGYQPKGDHLPTPPPIPEEILKSLERNAQDEAAGISDDGSYDAQRYSVEGGYDDNDNGQYNEKQSNTGSADVSASASFDSQTASPLSQSKPNFGKYSSQGSLRKSPVQPQDQAKPSFGNTFSETQGFGQSPNIPHQGLNKPNFENSGTQVLGQKPFSGQAQDQARPNFKNTYSGSQDNDFRQSSVPTQEQEVHSESNFGNAFIGSQGSGFGQAPNTPQKYSTKPSFGNFKPQGQPQNTFPQPGQSKPNFEQSPNGEAKPSIGASFIGSEVNSFGQSPNKAGVNAAGTFGSGFSQRQSYTEQSATNEGDQGFGPMNQFPQQSASASASIGPSPVSGRLSGSFGRPQSPQNAKFGYLPPVQGLQPGFSSAQASASFGRTPTSYSVQQYNANSQYSEKLRQPVSQFSGNSFSKPETTQQLSSFQQAGQQYKYPSSESVVQTTSVNQLDSGSQTVNDLIPEYPEQNSVNTPVPHTFQQSSGQSFRRPLSPSGHYMPANPNSGFRQSQPSSEAQNAPQRYSGVVSQAPRQTSALASSISSQTSGPQFKSTGTFSPTVMENQQTLNTPSSYSSQNKNRRPSQGQPQLPQNSQDQNIPDTQFTAGTQKPFIDFESQSASSQAQDDSYYYNQPSQPFQVSNQQQPNPSRFPNATPNQFDRITNQPSIVSQNSAQFRTPEPNFSRRPNFQSDSQSGSSRQQIQPAVATTSATEKETDTTQNTFETQAYSGITQATASSFPSPTQSSQYKQGFPQKPNYQQQQIQQSSFLKPEVTPKETTAVPQAFPQKPNQLSQKPNSPQQSNSFQGTQSSFGKRPTDNQQYQYGSEESSTIPVAIQQYDGELYEYNKPAEVPSEEQSHSAPQGSEPTPTEADDQNSALSTPDSNGFAAETLEPNEYNAQGFERIDQSSALQFGAQSSSFSSPSDGAFSQSSFSSFAGKGESFGGPRNPPSFDENGYHY